MSHFTVLVIGENAGAQLAPYHEYECTGLNDAHVVDVDVTEEIRAAMAGGESLTEALGSHGLESCIVADESEVNTGAGSGYQSTDQRAPHAWGYAIVKGGELIKAVNRTNPAKKWDWWVVGGRWGGYLKLKDGASGLASNARSGDLAPSTGTADVARIGDVDVAGMRAAAEQRAGQRFDRAAAALDSEGLSFDWLPWESVRDASAGNMEKARQDYNGQPAVAVLRKAFPDEFFFSPDEFQVSREAYVAAARASAFQTFAVVKDGKWYERGEMGWWGVVVDEQPADQWATKFAELVDGLPPETVVTVVDCHI